MQTTKVQSLATENVKGQHVNYQIGFTSRKHAYIILTPLNPTFI